MRKSASSGKILQTIVRVAGSLLAFGLLLYVLNKQHLLSAREWVQIWAKVAHIPPWQLLLMCALIFTSRCAVGGRWHVLLRATGAQVALRQSLKLTFAGLFATNFLPTTVGGDVVRLAGALRYKCDSGASVASLLLDRLVGMLGMALALPFALPGVLKMGPAAALLRHGAPAASFAAGVTEVTPRKGGRLARIFSRIVSALALGMRRPQSLLHSLLWTGVHMFCYFTSMFLLLHGMGEQIAYLQVAGLWGIVYFINLLPISINGLGTQEAATIIFFTHFGGVHHANVVILAMFMRVLPMLASVPGAFFLPSLLPEMRAQAQAGEPVG